MDTTPSPISAVYQFSGTVFSGSANELILTPSPFQRTPIKSAEYIPPVDGTNEQPTTHLPVDPPAHPSIIQQPLLPLIDLSNYPSMDISYLLY